jgi:oligo-1,6-glucosidase
MQWDGTPGAGFSTGRPWIDVNPNASYVNVADQRDDPASVLSFFRAVIALRHDVPAVAHGDFTMLVPDHESVYAFTRSYEDTELLVVANLTSTVAHIELPGWDDAEMLLSNYPAPAADDQRCASGPGALRPWQAYVLRSSRVSR